MGESARAAWPVTSPLRLEFAPGVDDEAIEAQRYHADISPELGLAFAVELDLALKRIVANPAMWPPHVLRTRRCMLDRFTYSVVYRVVADLITVYAVMHQHRRPDYWRRRVRG